jgi:hypothetical protein
MAVDLTTLFTPFKVLMTVFVVFAWSRAFFRYQDKTFTWKELLFWTLLWGAALIFIYTPGKTNFIARLIGVGRGADAIFTVSILVLFYIVYRLYAQVDKIERDITELVRRLALERRKKA